MNRAKKEAMIREARKPKAPKDIEVESKNTRLRVILLICSVILAVVFIAMGISDAVSTDPGWKTVESSAEGYHCGADLVFSYNFGATGLDPTDEEKAVKKVYSKATQDAYAYFYKEGQLATILPGQTVSIAPELYQALEMIRDFGNRSIYLAPVYVEYNRVFLCENEEEAMLYDPVQQPELFEYVQQVAAFANDPQAIDLELLGNDQVRLKVSSEYAAFAEENGIEAYLDFGWMRNAFVLDFIAQRLEQAGYSSGYLATYDGYTRNLDNSNMVYSLNLFDRMGNVINMPAAMDYTGPISIVFWRNYPLSENDAWHYYEFSNGRIATVYLDPADATEKSATDNLVSYAKDVGCAQILLETAPLYLTEELDEAALEALASQGIQSIWFQENRMHKTDPNVPIRENPDADQEYILN